MHDSTRSGRRAENPGRCHRTAELILNLTMAKPDTPIPPGRLLLMFKRSRPRKPLLWIGRRKTVGRGDGSSGLRFDVVE